MKHTLFNVAIITVLVLVAHIASMQQAMTTPIRALLVHADPPPDDDREDNGFVFKGLETRDSRRSFYGAPPVIPHRIGNNDRECLNCHTEPKTFLGHTSMPTPHPELNNCQQCHVRGKRPVIFKKSVTVDSNWLAATEPKLGNRNHPLAPPTIPHRLHMRDNCAACHHHRHPNEDQRVDHSQRKNCMQCHVPDDQQATSPFSHEFKE